MAPTKAKGDLAELKVAADLIAKGYRVALPFGEDCDYDLTSTEMGSWSGFKSNMRARTRG
jgi:hypothetical protein